MGLISGVDLQFDWDGTTEPQVNDWQVNEEGLIEKITHSGLSGGTARCEGIVKWEGSVAGVGGGLDPGAVGGGDPPQSPIPFPNDTGTIKAVIGMSQEAVPTQVGLRGNAIVHYLDIFVPCAGYHGNTCKYEYGFKSNGYLYYENMAPAITNSAVPFCHSALRAKPRIGGIELPSAIWARARFIADVRPYSDTSVFEDIGGGDYRGSERHLAGALDAIVQIAYHEDEVDELHDVSNANDAVDIFVSTTAFWRIDAMRFTGLKSGASVNSQVPRPSDASKNAHFVGEWRFNIMGDGSALGSIVDPNGVTQWP